MRISPSYADLGKAARDILKKGFGFGFGVVKPDMTTMSHSGVELSTTSSSNTDLGKFLGPWRPSTNGVSVV